MEKLQENLGKFGRDKITGYEGIITAYAKHLFGCDSYFLTAKCKDNKREDSGNGWYDVGRIEIIGEGVCKEDVQADKPGGDGLAPPDQRM